MRNYSERARIDKEFARQLREVARVRVEKRLAMPKIDEISIREMTNLTTRTSSWPLVLEELKTKPKRR